MQFYHSEWLIALWLVPLFAVLMFLAQKRKASLIKRFGHWHTVSQLIQNHSFEREKMKKVLQLIVLALLILTLAQPQWGNVQKEIHRKGVEIMFLVDTSLSMLTEDAAPNRISQAKFLMKSFLSHLKGDRIGLVTFAGSGFIQSPLTLDYDAFLLFANSLEVGYIPDAGTSLSEAIRTAVKAFPQSEQKHHVIILLSDGEHLEGDVADAIKSAKQSNARIYTIGIGTSEGAPIPLRSEDGRVSGYKKDKNGEIVISKTNEKLLKEIAEETGGLYFPATSGNKIVEWIYQHMQNIEKQEFEQRIVVQREDQFQFFLTCAVILLLIEMFLSEKRRVRK